jgi:hypothetical protein
MSLIQEITAAHAKHVDAQFGEGATGATPLPPSMLLLDLNQQLTLSPSGSRSRNTCQNVKVRPRMWARDDPRALDMLVNPHAGFLNRLGQLCVGSKIRSCNSRACVANQRAMSKVAPACEWQSFREWALVAMSCQASFSHEQKLTRAYTHIVSAVSLCHWILNGYKLSSTPFTNVLVGRRQHSVDLLGVCDLIYWMLTIQASIGLGNVIEGKWGPEFLPQNVILPALMNASTKARKLGLCQNRLWNLSIVSERKQADLPGLMESAQHYPALKHVGHNACTAAFCHFTAIDSTKMEQLHRCANPGICSKLTFPPEVLEASIKRGWGTTWSSNERRTIAPSERYVAISHVWSDGTGIGLAKPGIINSCLFEYFNRIVKKLQCVGIWWDTISIPVEPVARRIAINNMHDNYANAAFTVVHDQYLLQFDWADDGSPAIALVFTPWFTRGWTALELAISKNVKVLFKGPNPDTPLIKDLDTEILAQDPSRASRAHWIVSSLIRRLRKPISNVSDLLTILQPRSTSWPRDRMMIAGLLTNIPDVDYAHSQGKMTRDILKHVGKIRASCLMHGQVTMFDSGGFSWCPSALYDMPPEGLGDLEAGALSNDALTVDSQGTVTGSWYYRTLTRKDAEEGRLLPHSSHPSVDTRIKVALQTYENCLILREDRQSRGPALLVTVVGHEGHPDNMSQFIINCRYVGSVREFYSPAPGGGYDHRYKYGDIRLGADGDLPDVNAYEILGPQDEGVTGNSEEEEFNAEDQGTDSEEIPEDGEDGWLDSDSNGPRRPR